MDAIDGEAVAGEAISALQTMTQSVLSGQESAERLSFALEMARAEIDAIVQQLSDETFATDDVAKAWRQEGLEALYDFHASLGHMLGALYEVVNPDALLQGLEYAVAAEARVRALFVQSLEASRAMQAHMEEAQRVPCMRCGHRNMPGGGSCAQCRFPLPNIGLERVETDLVGGEPTSGFRSALLDGLWSVLNGLDGEGGTDAAREFLSNLERLQTLARRQLDNMLSSQDGRYEAVQYTVEIRRRVEDVRQMVEAVRIALEAGDAGPLQSLPAWLEEQFLAMQELKAAVMELTGAAP